MTTAEERFWNNPEVVKEFELMPPSPYWKKFFQQIKNPASKKVLDIGCGGGRNTQMLIELNFNTYACDYYIEMVKATRKRIARITNDQNIKKRIIQASMLDLPYPDEYFNLILANGVFHNVSSKKEMETAIKESSRVLKPKGQICVNLFSNTFIDSKLYKINTEKYIYVTPQGLTMALLPKKTFLKIMENYNLILDNQLTEYKREVSTGKRWVIRGIFRKKL
ncbi:MAG TPA: class I SAM-dependent methyltransferase [Candidatus Atribacteria bacterium]|nr:class I SAM-dependent methyltransferase [Candidatus Atribacteria bacterium]